MCTGGISSQIDLTVGHFRVASACYIQTCTCTDNHDAHTLHATRSYLDVGAELVDTGVGRLSDDPVFGRPLVRWPGGKEWCRSWPESGGAFCKDS